MRYFIHVLSWDNEDVSHVLLDDAGEAYVITKAGEAYRRGQWDGDKPFHFVEQALWVEVKHDPRKFLTH